MYIKLFLISFLFSIYSIYGQGITFKEEYIDFSIVDSRFKINGIYMLVNESDQDLSQYLLYPFPDDSTTIDSIFVYDYLMGNIYFERNKNSIGFEVNVPSGETLLLNIGYQQLIHANHIKYILTTTKFWNKPLNKAVYSLTTNKDIVVDFFSYEPDTLIENGDQYLYKWEKYNFMPEKDFEMKIRTLTK